MEGAPEWFSGNDVQKYLTYEDLIPIIEGALASFSQGHAGGVLQPVRMSMGIEEHKGVFLVMPAYSSKDNALATKLVSLYPENSAVGLPSHMGVIVLFDPVHGAPKAMMDAEVITGMRTAAASAVATKYLAPENSKILTVIGAGVQAITHIQAIRQVCKFEEVRIWSRTFSKAQKVADEFGCVACKTIEEAVKDADVITTVTTSKTPVLNAEWVKDGAHVNCVGACVKDWQELDPALMKKADVYADTKEAALKESGDIIMSGVEVLCEIGELVLGTKKADRNATTVFKSMGMAIEDVVSAKLVYDKKHGSTSSQ
ncbi:ketimine reductase mu-crystallin-like [Amphiura filiformis]|uniref:ketimine reductase mu-crystallin-like n=1 Tax=Amphiura filiformis TaxID=82378 RepID=UPI003B21E86C